MSSGARSAGEPAGADVVAELAGVGSELAAARRVKPEFVAETQRAYDALFAADGPLAPAVRRGLAALVARWHGADDVVAHHTARGADAALYADELPADPALRAAAEHLDLITVSPALARREDVDRLAAAGWGPDAVVAISQVAAYTAFQVRLVEGLRLLQGAPTAHGVAPARTTRGRGRTKSLAEIASNGAKRPTAYTQELLAWTAWVPPVAADDLTDEQREAFAGKTNDGYFRLLSRLPKLLRARTAVDKAVFYTREGLPRAERELAATVTSKVNDCVYCASVHSRKASQLSHRTDDVQRVLDAVLDRDPDWRATDLAPLAAGQDARWSAVAAFAAALSTTPASATPDHIAELRGHGLTDVELVDLVGSVAFFSWANRLMLTLGEPFWPGTEPAAA
ncbi:CMD domain-containing protein [Marinactinospora rubrisoli]|uniref:CMD domain-containing protein n=1 Tax=Marinactinospora rubrisoli TaxID=2715399 RepID=A0ABW2KJL6_9ACTN